MVASAVWMAVSSLPVSLCDGDGVHCVQCGVI